MPSYSIVQKSQLEGAKRLDAEYYQPEYLQIRDLVSKRNLNAKSLAGLISRQVVTGSTPKIREPKGDDTDIYFIKKDTVRDGQVVFVEVYRLPAKQNIQNSAPKGGDVLVTIIGATFDIVGRSAMVFPHYPKMNINQNVALNRPAIENILVPVPVLTFQREVEKLVQESHDCISQSVVIYNTAESLLLEELGLKDFKADEDIYSVVNFSDIRVANRIDAEYYQPKYGKLESKIKKYEHKPLEKVLENIPAKFDPMKQPDKSFKYVELSNINATTGIIDGFSEALGKETPSRAKRILKEKDVIVSSVEGSLGKIALVQGSKRDFLASTGFFQFRSKEVLPEVLLVLAKS